MALPPLNIGIQTRLTAGIALVASLLVLVVGWTWTSYEEDELMQALRQREARMAGLVERGFAGPIWNLDHVAIENLLDAVMADPEVHAIELKGLGLRGGQGRRERDHPAVGPLRSEFPITYQPAADAPAADASDSGGCSLGGTPGKTSPFGVALFTVLGLALFRQRRRAK